MLCSILVKAALSGKMTNHRRSRGLATERLVADYLREWWQYATVGRGADPSGDIVNLPFDVEVKGVAKFAPLAWLRQSKARTTKSGKLGVVVLRCNGQGTLVSEYAALLPLHALVELLLRAGYDKIPLELNPIRCNKCGGWIIEKMECTDCGAQANRIYSVPGIVFKGKGFYSTDNK